MSVSAGVRIPRDPISNEITRFDGDTVTSGQPFTEGWSMMRAAAGTLQIATEVTGLLPGGFVDRDLVTADPNGNDFANVRTGIYAVDMSALSGDAFLNTDPPGPIYAVDNQLFGKLPVNPSTGAARSIAGCFLRLDRPLFAATSGGKALMWIGPEGAALGAALQASQNVTTRDLARGVFTVIDAGTTYASGVLSGPANTAISAQDGLTPALLDVFFAQKGMTNLPAAAQAGPWQIIALGSGSSQWKAVRPWWYPTGGPIPVDFTIRIAPSGTGTAPQYAGTRWMAFAGSGLVIDTGDPLFWPQREAKSVTASSGVVLNADTTFAIRSTTLSRVTTTNQGTASHASTVGPPRVTAITAGAAGSSSLTIKAESAPGTTNTSDVGVYTVVIDNW